MSTNAIWELMTVDIFITVETLLDPTAVIQNNVVSMKCWIKPPESVHR